MCRLREGHGKALLSALAVFALICLSTTIAVVQGIERYIRTTRRLNRRRTRALLKQLHHDGKGQREYEYLNQPREQITIVGFFHPFCNAGGGGERVLFQALAHHQAQDPNILCVVYTGDLNHDDDGDDEDAVTKEDILARAHQRFGIALSPARVHFVPLTRRFLVEDGYWEHFTLLGQSLGAAVLGAEAMAQLTPDIFIDTMGYAFAYPIVRFFAPGIPIGAYVHYPTISTDMLERVKSRAAGHTNDAAVAGSEWRTHAKLIYYHLFASAYTFCLGRANAIVANSSWTKAHLDTLLFGKPPKKNAKPIPVAAGSAGALTRRAKSTGRKKRTVEIVYPPCDTTAFSAFPLEAPRDPGLLVSLAQFRPEKEHATQLRLLRALFDLDPAYRTGGTLASSGTTVPQVRLILMGSCRNAGDEARIESLKELARELGIQDSLRFKVNVPFSDILSTLSRASIGLSTMIDEHFGINVVEFMAAGLITLSHASAGPYLDIAVPILAPPTLSPSTPTPAQQHRSPFDDDDDNPHPTTPTSAPPSTLPTGFHAHSPQDFAAALAQIFALPEEERHAIRARARARALECFGSEGFEAGWRSCVWDVLVDAHAERRRKAEEAAGRRTKSD
ncbi:hypothetical protein V8E36_003591 [Tilletia maclaganii]